MFNSLKLNTRFAAAAFGALAIGATAFSAPAVAAPLPLFPFFLPQIEATPPPVEAVPRDEERSVELPAQYSARIASERLAVRSRDVADESRYAILRITPRKNLERRKVGQQQHV